MSSVEEQRQEIENLMEYAVPEELMDEALDLLDIYRNDRIALELLREFYRFLPEAKNDLVREIRLAARKQGVLLLMAITGEARYFYLVSSEGVEFQGRVAEGVYDNEILDFFGYESREELQKESRVHEKYEIYKPIDSDESICPACHAATGELHELGCPVELCPWCGGQLVYCTCRYDQLEVESMSTEEDIRRFEEILEERGRIPYSPEQRPNFPDEGPGVIIE